MVADPVGGVARSREVPAGGVVGVSAGLGIEALADRGPVEATTAGVTEAPAGAAAEAPADLVDAPDVVAVDPLGVMGQALEVLAGQVLSGAVDDAALAWSVAVLQRLETRVAAEKLRRVAEVDARSAPGPAGRRDSEALLTGLGLTRGEARVAADTAAGLRVLPRTAAGLAAGDVGVGQAGVAARAAATVDAGLIGGLDALVADTATAGDRHRLRAEVDRWVAVNDPDGLAGREVTAWRRRTLSITRDSGGDGAVVVTGRLDPVGGAQLHAAVTALARPDDGAQDRRSHPQRMADAVVELARAALDGGTLPTVAAQRPHVLLVTTPDALHAIPGADPATIDGIGPVSPALARQVCCDADLTPVTVDRDGAVLDAGRTRRLPSRRQRAAVLARDRTCVGCHAPAARCQIHHLRWWRHGGPTNVDNLCLVCWDCHTNIHHNGWHVTRTPNGNLTVRPPPPPNPIPAPAPPAAPTPPDTG